MGGTVKKVGGTIGQGLGDVFTLGLDRVGGSGNPLKAVGSDVGSALTLGSGGHPIMNPLTGQPLYSGASNPYIAGPFTLDPNQMSGDQAAINSEGQRQYDATLKGISDVSTANTARAKALFGQMLPDIAENSQAAHLYDSTGYGQEVARQQSNIASEVANQEAQQKLQALSGLQGFQTGALQRGLSLEDFINQANVAKTIGAQMAPQPPSGKAQFGTVASGIGALSPWGRLAYDASAGIHPGDQKQGK